MTRPRAYIGDGAFVLSTLTLLNRVATHANRATHVSNSGAGQKELDRS
jgi:hypothetical protein